MPHQPYQAHPSDRADRSDGADPRAPGESGHTSVEVLAWTSATIAGVSILVQALTAGLGMLACQAAADHALQATRVAAGTPAAGQADALRVLDQISGRLLRDPQIEVTRSPGATSVVTVRASVPGVLPLLRIRMKVTSSGPTEPDSLQPLPAQP